MPRGTILTKYGETRLLQEYVSAVYGQEDVYLRMRLGAAMPLTPAAAEDEAGLAMVGVYRRWADAVVVTRDEVIIVEAKVRSNPGAISQLELYDELVPYTPELRPYLSRRRRLELVQAIGDPAVSRLCEKKGIRCVLWVPDWLPEYLAQLHRRETRAPRDFASGAS
jgi:hypothetical protein